MRLTNKRIEKTIAVAALVVVCVALGTFRASFADEPTAESRQAPSASTDATGKTPLNVVGKIDKTDSNDALGASRRTAVGAFVSTVGALALTLGFFFAVVYLLKLLAPNRLGAGSGTVEILDATTLGKTRLTTIRWGNRALLVAQTGNEVATLAETSEPGELETIANAARRRLGRTVGASGGWVERLAARLTAKSKKSAYAESDAKGKTE